MPKRSLIEQVNEAVQAMLASLPPRPEAVPHRNLARLAAIARELRYLPRQEFRAALKSDLQRRAFMSAHEGTETSAAAAPAKAVHYMRPGFTSITPYIIVKGAAQFIEFLKNAFAGVERFRVPAPDGSLMHSEIAIGNGMIEAGDTSAQVPPAPAAIHLYVEDADTTYSRALQAGATSLFPVADQPWGDRWGAAKDPFGNHWHIATPKGWTPGPEGLPSVQPFLYLCNAHEMIPFMEAAFGAESLGVAQSPEGIVLHGTMRIGDATLEISEAQGELQPMPCHLHVYVQDSDAMYGRALRAGAASVEPPTNKPYGDRSAAVKDSFGNTWYLNTFLGK